MTGQSLSEVKSPVNKTESFSRTVESGEKSSYETLGPSLEEYACEIRCRNSVCSGFFESNRRPKRTDKRELFFFFGNILDDNIHA